MSLLLDALKKAAIEKQQRDAIHNEHLNEGKNSYFETEDKASSDNAETEETIPTLNNLSSSLANETVSAPSEQPFIDFEKDEPSPQPASIDEENNHHINTPKTADDLSIPPLSSQTPHTDEALSNEIMSDEGLSIDNDMLWHKKADPEKVHVENDQAIHQETSEVPAKDNQADIKQLITARMEEKKKENIKRYGTYSVIVALCCGSLIYYQQMSHHPQSNLTATIFGAEVISEPAVEIMPLPVLADPALVGENLKGELHEEGIPEAKSLVHQPSVEHHQPIAEEAASKPHQVTQADTTAENRPVKSVKNGESHAENTAAKPKPTIADTASLTVEKPSASSTPYINRVVQEADIINELVNKAYQYYLNDQLVLAKAIYENIIEQSPRKKDAIRGLAAIASRQGNEQEALHYYQQLLNISPQDIYAKTGLLSLQANTGNDELWLSKTSQLLKDFPDIAHIHLLNANAFAATGNWQSAQKGYFEAWSRDTNNPDYAYNLAISLDQLNQPKDALQYYKMANNLNKKYPSNINDSVLLRRITQLQGAYND